MVTVTFLSVPEGVTVTADHCGGDSKSIHLLPNQGYCRGAGHCMIGSEEGSDCCYTLECPQAGLPDGDSQILRLYVFGPSGLKDYGSATLRCKI